MGAPMACSRGGQPIFKRTTAAAACKKDRGDPEPVPPAPGAGRYWVWVLHSYSLAGYGTETDTYYIEKLFDLGDKSVSDSAANRYFMATLSFGTVEEVQTYINTYSRVNTTLFHPNWNALPSSDTGEGLITVSVAVGSNSSYPSPYWVWTFSEPTNGKEFLIIPVNASAMNGMHSMAVSGWVSFRRIRWG